MAACSIIRDENNIIQFAEAPNGARSILFDKIVERTGDVNEALPIWLTSKTKSFKESVSSPKLNNHRAQLMTSIDQVSPKDSRLTVLEGGKEVEVNLDYLEFTDLKGAAVGTKSLNTISVYAPPVKGGKRIKLGRIRYSSKGTNLEIDSSTLSPLQRYNKGKITDIKGLGIGSRLYAELFKKAFRAGRGVVSSDNLSPESTALWESMVNKGLAVKVGDQYALDIYPPDFDQNGEPKMESVLDFIDKGGVTAKEAAGTPIEEKAAIKGVMMGLPVSNSEELLYKLKVGFMPLGSFRPTRASLQQARIYDSQEITDIMTDEALQERIRDFIYRLEDLQAPILNDIYSDETYMTIKNGEKNSIGKFNLNNPYIVEKELIEKLGGIELRSNFEEQMMSDDQAADTIGPNYMDRVNTRGDFFNLFNKFKPVGELTLEEGQLVPKTNDTREVMEQTLMEAENELLERELDFLVSLDDSLWREAPEQVTKLIKKASDKMVQMGIDSTGLLEVAKKKSIAETKGFLTAVRNAAIELNEGTFNTLVGEYNEYFDVSENFQYRKVTLPGEMLKDNTFYVTTEIPGIETFRQAELIPVGNNIYKRVRTESSSQLIDSVLQMSFASNGYTTILPKEAFKPAGFDADGNLNMAKMQDRNNALALRDSVDAWVDSQVKHLYTEGLGPIEAETLRQYVLYFNYFNRDTSYSKFDPKPKQSQEYNLISEPVNNVPYLATDFIADFHKKILTEKKTNSKAYQDFYSNFKVTKLGLELVNEDPISKAAMEPYLEENEDLVNYFRVHKLRRPLVEKNIVDPIRDELFRRNYYANYPTFLDTFEGSYSELTPNTLAAKTKEPFIRTRKGLFELVSSIGRVGIYGRVETNPGVFKRYDANLNPPIIDADTNVLNGIDTNIQDVTEIKNLYDESEKKGIDDKHDNCR